MIMGDEKFEEISEEMEEVNKEDIPEMSVSKKLGGFISRSREFIKTHGGRGYASGMKAYDSYKQMKSRRAKEKYLNTLDKSKKISAEILYERKKAQLQRLKEKTKRKTKLMEPMKSKWDVSGMSLMGKGKSKRGLQNVKLI